MRGKRFRALALAAGLVGWSGVVAPRIPARPQLLLHAVASALLVGATDAPLGLRRPAVRRGLGVGLAAATAVTAAIGVTMTLPRVRVAMAERVLPESVAGWLLVHIPVGTVWSEEAAYRAALGTLAVEAFGPRSGRLLQAAAFGLSHVSDARGAGEPVVGTVVVTGAAGWAFGWLHSRSGSLLAPMLAHVAINEAGALGTLAIQRFATLRHGHPPPCRSGEDARGSVVAG